MTEPRLAPLSLQARIAVALTLWGVGLTGATWARDGLFSK